jgi:cardiolipin synthase
VPAQVVPTGPSTPDATFRRLLLAAVQCARRQVTLTTPYFVPDEPTQIALLMAVDRGVEVTVNVPARLDSRLTAAASQSHYDALLRGGVRIRLYRPGLLHAKVVTVDEAFAVLGSANVDVRSFNLNFELSVVLYGREITDRLRHAQAEYLEDSVPVDPTSWAQRPVVRQYADRAIALLSPLL